MHVMDHVPDLARLRSWQPPPGSITLTTLDVHTAGEPLRIITGGYPTLDGGNLLARRRQARALYEDLRKLLMWEPRGHREMYGCVLTPPDSPGADFGVIFLHNEGYSTMCGHAIIALATVAVETGMVAVEEPETVIRIDTPAGLVTATAFVKNGQVQKASFYNVPSFAVELDAMVTIPGIGHITYDLAFGGAFYAYVQAAEVGLSCYPSEHNALVDTGMAIKRAVMASRKMGHPFEEDLDFLYGTIFIDEPAAPDAHSRNVCIFADGQVDRSPTGTGVSGRAALHHARGELAVGVPLVIESLIGSRFSVTVERTTTFGPYAAVIPRVEGQAFITGQHRFVLDPKDEIGPGFLV